MQAEAALRQAELIRDGPIHEAVAWVGRRAGNKGMCVCVSAHKDGECQRRWGGVGILEVRTCLSGVRHWREQDRPNQVVDSVQPLSSGGTIFNVPLGSP